MVIGSDFSDNTDEGRDELPRELAFNARLATEFGSVVIPVVSGEGRTAESLAGGGAQCVPLAHRSRRDGAAVIANRVPPASPAPPGLPVPSGRSRRSPAVAAPTVGEVAAALDATVLTGSEAPWTATCSTTSSARHTCRPCSTT